MRKIAHGFCKRSGKRSAEYNAWCAMKQRCYNPNSEQYKYYGGRGITVCDRWLNSFENFIADMGNRPSERHSLDRYPDNNGNYEPDNCRWATSKEQNLNKRKPKYHSRGGYKIKVKAGEVLPLELFSNLLGVPPKSLYERYVNQGWSLAATLTTSKLRNKKENTASSSNSNHQ